MRLPIAAITLAAAATGLASGPAAAQQIQAGGSSRCADYGSFAVVDAAPAPRGAPITARSWHPCAELPGSPQQPPLYIDAQVQIGGQGTTTGTATGTGIGTGIGAGNGGVAGMGGGTGGWQRPPDPGIGSGAMQPLAPGVPPGGGFTSRVWRR